MPAERCVRIGDNKGAKYASDNFWQMADTGPCGPCSEIFYDHGPEVWGGPPGIARGRRRPLHRDLEPRVHAVQPRRQGRACTRCPSRRVDTGMGLERLAAVLQHVHSNYEIDLFQDLIRAAVRETGATDYLNPVAAGDRRPHPRLRVPDRRRRDPAATTAAATCCAGSSAARSATATSSGQKQPFFHKLVDGPRPRRWATRIRSCAATRRASRRC